MLLTSSLNDYTFQVNGFQIHARYYSADIDEIFLPLLRELSRRQKAKNKRLLVLLAAPPGVGKTTLSLLLEQLSRERSDILPIQAVGLDGFHYPQAYLDSHTAFVNGAAVPMKTVKGCPETFDLEQIIDKVKLLREHEVAWPLYDRNLHDVVEDGLWAHGKIVLIEGNWLLLDEPKWRSIKDFSDYSVFVSAEETMLKERLIQRKITGGLSPVQAEEFYNRSDYHNIRRVMDNRLTGDMDLQLLKNGKYVKAN